ncbi:hypothetical protein HYN48_04470 [Flavobacterium magnum]|uniref:Lipoprotein n=1 Tax=Flavobacterium magnum TaxID=2162713 RepID=A0A2S0RBJ9_9FLAO|nr:hypothetical protein [Flavobacterium magnum]AWA29397.1 hypothetical protein HYN48_04470 [Flavobacterium magnum]
MKVHPLLACLFSLLLFSCQDDQAKRTAEIQKDLRKKEAVFNVIERSWNFNDQPVNTQTQDVVGNWQEWRLFLTALRQKPKSSIGAFKKKAQELSKRVLELNNNLPMKFAQPEIRSRIVALTTKIRSLDLYINLDDIPEQKVVMCISDINATLFSLKLQMEEVVSRDNVPLERGESDMIRMLDTTRAIPNNPIKLK